MLITRAALFRLATAGLVAAALFPFAIYHIGLAVGPERPSPAAAAVPPLIAKALWARADGGVADALTPITPITMAQFLGCVAIEDFKDTTPGDARRVVACRSYLPALAGLEYLSTMHMRDASLKPSFREGLGRMSTTIWMTHAWTKAEFLNTLAERGEIGAGFRGVDAASQGLFGRRPDALTLPQAALIGGLMGNRRINPWCEVEAAAALRNRVLERMRDDGVIDDTAFETAAVVPLDLAPPPEGRLPCRD